MPRVRSRRPNHRSGSPRSSSQPPPTRTHPSIINTAGVEKNRMVLAHRPCRAALRQRAARSAAVVRRKMLLCDGPCAVWVRRSALLECHMQHLRRCLAADRGLDEQPFGQGLCVGRFPARRWGRSNVAPTPKSEGPCGYRGRPHPVSLSETKATVWRSRTPANQTI